MIKVNQILLALTLIFAHPVPIFAKNIGEINNDLASPDANEKDFTDVKNWSHPVKDVLKKYHLDLVKVELRLNRKFPIFHVKDFGADPASSLNTKFFNGLTLDLLKANGYNSFKIVEDNIGDGYIVLYDKSTHVVDREMVQDVKP